MAEQPQKPRRTRPQPSRTDAPPSVADGLAGQKSQVAAFRSPPPDLYEKLERATKASNQLSESLDKAASSVATAASAAAASYSTWQLFRTGAENASLASVIFGKSMDWLSSSFPKSTTAAGVAWKGFTAAIDWGAKAAVPSLTALWAAAAPIVLPLAAIAAVAATAWAMLTKWQQIPTWIKILFPPLIVMKLYIEALALPFRLAWAAAKLFFDAVLLPFRILAGTAKLAVAAVSLLPGALARIPGAARAAAGVATTSLGWIASAGWTAAGKVSTALGKMSSAALSAGWTVAKGMTSAVLSVVGGIVQAPARIYSAVMQGTFYLGKRILGEFAELVRKVGATASNLGNQVVAPITAAAVAFAAGGVELSKMQAEYKLTAGQASVFAAAARITGRSVEDLVKIMPAGSAAFAAFGREAQASGSIMSTQEIADANALSLAYARLKEAKSGLWTLVATTMAPAIKESTDLVLSAVRAATTWIRENRELLGTVFRVGSALVTVGTVFTVLGTAAGAVGSALVAVGLSVGGLVSVLVPLAATATSVAAGFAAWDSAAGRATRNLAGGVWDRYGESVTRAWQTTLTYGRQIVGYARGVMQGVTDAIRGGDLELAATIAMTGARLAWVKGLSELSSLTSGVLGAIFAQLAGGNWSMAAEVAMTGVRIVWLQGIGVLKGIWLQLQDVWTSLRISADEAFVAVANSADTAFVRMIDAADPWWLSLQSGFRQGRNEVDVWVTATIAGIQTLAKTVYTFSGLFVKTILGPLQFLPGMVGKVNAIIAGMAKPDEWKVLTEVTTEEAVKRNAPPPARPPVPPATQAEQGQRPGESREDFYARMRRERRNRELQERTTGRIGDFGGRRVEAIREQGNRRATEYGEQVARDQQIAALQRRIAELQQQGDATATEKAAALQLQLESAKSEAARAAEEARLRNADNNLDAANQTALTTQVEKANKGREAIAGTMSSAAALAMFGGGAASDQVLRDQLREQREQTRLARETKNWQDKALRVLGPRFT